MTKARLTTLTALVLVLIFAGVYAARRYLLGADVSNPRAAYSWKVKLVVSGTLSGGDDRVVTARPPDFRNQHISRGAFESRELSRSPLTVLVPGHRFDSWRPPTPG